MDNKIPGIHLLPHLLIELANGNIDVSEFENPIFFLRLSERNDLSDEKRKNAHLQNSFGLKYVTCERGDHHTQKLYINSNAKNVDWCLDKLKSEKLNEAAYSRVVYKCLTNLRECFEVEISSDSRDEEELKVIHISREKQNELTIDMVRERFIKLTKIDANMRNSLSSYANLNPLIGITHELSERAVFIGRHQLLSRIETQMDKSGVYPSHFKKRRLYREYAKKGIKIFLQKYGMISFDNLYCFLRHKLTFFFLFSFCFLFNFNL